MMVLRMTVPPEPASTVPPGGEPDEGWPVSTLESIASVAPFSASSSPPPSLIAWPPVLSVNVMLAPEAFAMTEPVLSNVRSLDAFTPSSPIWPEARALMVLWLVKVAAALPSLVMSAPAPFSPMEPLPVTV